MQSTTNILNLTNSIDNASPKAVPFTFSVASGVISTIDLTQLMQTGRIDSVQTIFVDNTSNSATLLIVIQGTQQILQIPGGAQAYLPVLARNPTQITLNSPGSIATAISIVLLNIPLPAIVWTPTTKKTTYGAAFNIPSPITGSLVAHAVLVGSASKVIKVRNVAVYVNGATSGTTAISLQKLSSVSGGTSNASLIVPFDSTDMAATAILDQYVASPTITSIGTIRLIGLVFGTAINTVYDGVVWPFEFQFAQEPTLRGSSQFFAIMANLPSGTSSIVGSFEWTEE